MKDAEKAKIESSLVVFIAISDASKQGCQLLTIACIVIVKRSCQPERLMYGLP